MRKGENPSKLINNFEDKIPEIQAQLPKSVKLVPLYERKDLINKTLDTIGHNIIHGIIFVVLILKIQPMKLYRRFVFKLDYWKRYLYYLKNG